MSALRRSHAVPEAAIAAALGALIAGGALGASLTHSKYVAVVVIAGFGALVALAVGNLRRFLLLAVLFDIPLQWAKDLGWNQAAANLGALGGLNISVTTLALTGLYILWAIERGEPRSAAPRARWRPAAPLIAFVAIEAASLAVARDRTLGAFELALLVQTLLLFVYIVSTVRTRADVNLIVTGLIASLFMESVLIIGVRVTGVQFHFAGLTTHTQAGGEDTRLGGTIGQPNTAAAFLCLLLPLAATLPLAPISRAMRRLCIVSLPVGGIALIITQSRGGWVSISISALVLAFVLVRRGLIRGRTVLAAIAVIAVIAVPLWGTISSRVTGSDNGSAAARVSLATLAWHMIEDHPLLGVGINNVGLNVPSYAGPQFDGTFIYEVHDKYLLVWSEAGIFALIAFVTFLAVTLRRGWRAARSRDPFLSYIALGLTAGLMGQIVHMGVDLFESRPQVQLLWLVAALLAALCAMLERERHQAGPVHS
jgi:putative inorganic carbon (HCO3(-)) transporter